MSKRRYHYKKQWILQLEYSREDPEPRSYITGADVVDAIELNFPFAVIKTKALDIKEFVNLKKVKKEVIVYESNRTGSSLSTGE